MVSWKELQELKYDKKQTKLSNNGCIKNTFQFAIGRRKLSYYDIMTCPFCLNYYELHLFKSHSGLYECPNCHNELKQSSLILDLSTDDLIEKFARWVYAYRVNGFWRKIFPDFKTWCKRLWELRISKVFWEKYKSLRGDTNNEVNEYE